MENNKNSNVKRPSQRRRRNFTGEDIEMLREKNSRKTHRSICDYHEDGA